MIYTRRFHIKFLLNMCVCVYGPINTIPYKYYILFVTACYSYTYIHTQTEIYGELKKLGVMKSTKGERVMKFRMKLI